MTREEVVVYFRRRGFVQIESCFHVNNYAQFALLLDKELATIAVDNAEIYFWDMLEATDRRVRLSFALNELDGLKMAFVIVCHAETIRWLKQELGVKE